MYLKHNSVVLMLVHVQGQVPETPRLDVPTAPLIVIIQWYFLDWMPTFYIDARVCHPPPTPSAVLRLVSTWGQLLETPHLNALTTPYIVKLSLLNY